MNNTVATNGLSVLEDKVTTSLGCQNNGPAPTGGFNTATKKLGQCKGLQARSSDDGRLKPALGLGGLAFASGRRDSYLPERLRSLRFWRPGVCFPERRGNR